MSGNEQLTIALEAVEEDEDYVAVVLADGREGRMYVACGKCAATLRIMRAGPPNCSKAPEFNVHVLPCPSCRA